MRSHARARTGRAAVTFLFAAARELLNVRAWSALARLTALGVLLALPMSADAAEPSAPSAPRAAPAAPSATVPSATVPSATVPSATVGPAAPESVNPLRGNANHTITPSASPEWVDRLANARRRVLDANAASEAANQAYANALYSALPEGLELDRIKARRTTARRKYVDAMEALTPLVERAREAGVSPEVLKIYEASIRR